MLLAKTIIYRARGQEDAPAIATTAGVATYGMLARTIESTVDKLAELDLADGSIVVIDVRNPLRHIALLVSLALLGLTSASAQSRAHLLQTGVRPDAVLTDAADFVVEGAKVALVDDSWFLIDPARPVDYPRLLALPGLTDPKDVIRVSFSSGTTGYPKAVALTVGAATRRMLNAIALSGAAGGDVRILTLLGFSTLNGFAAPFTTLAGGGLIAYAADVANAIHLIRMFRIEVLSGAVGQLNALVKALEGKPPLPSLSRVGTGGSKLPPRLLANIRERIGPNITFVYASTEAGAISMANGGTLDRFPGSAGHLLPWVELQIVDADGNPQPGNADGIIRVRTDEFAGYLSDSTDTTEMFRDGWFYPGDVGHISAEGVVYVTGRSNEVINRGGQIIAPDVIEESLLAFPGITDAAVFGHPNADGLEEIWAAVVSAQWVDANAVRQVIGARLPERTPDRVVQVESIPRNEMGKIRRNELREQLTKPA